MKLSLLLVALLQVGCAAQATSITQFGAVGDGKTLNTAAIQRAIDHVAANGGGVVAVPKGAFVSGALFFKSGVDLLVQKDGILKGTTNQSDYPLVQTRWEGVEGKHTCAFLNFDGMNHVRLSGQGTIDGSGDVWVRQMSLGRRGGRGPFTRPFSRPSSRPAFLFQQVGRPRLICFSNCTDVRISDVHLQKQAIWCLHILYCRDVVVDNVNIRATLYIPSSDGIDVDSSRDVVIRRCDIACYDDNISIKSGKDADGRRVNRPSENILITDCTFGIGDGVAMGSEVTGGIRHVMVQRCLFNGTNTGCRFKSQPSRGGVIEDIVFRDIRLNDVRRAFEFLMDWGAGGARSRLSEFKPPTIVRDVRLINYTGTAESGGAVEGLPDGPVRDVQWENCNLSLERGMRIENAADLDTSGLRLKVQEGAPIIQQSAP